MVDTRSNSISKSRAFTFLKALTFLAAVVVMPAVRVAAQDPAIDAIPEPVVVSPLLFPLGAARPRNILTVASAGHLESSWNLGHVNLSPLSGDPIVRDSSINDMDPSVKPGDDFYRYANGGWLRRSAIPAREQSYGTREMLKEKTSEEVRNLIHNAVATYSAKGSITQKVGDYYASLMDEASIEAKGLKPLAVEMAAIAVITNKVLLSAYLGSTLNNEVDGLTTNADHVIGMWINQGFDDSQHNLPHLWEGGLELHDRDNYTDMSPNMVELRTKYQAHIAAVLKLAGFADSQVRAAHILSFETHLARTFAPDSDAVDVSKQNNPWKRADFEVKAPGMEWEAYFKSAGLAGQSDFIVWQPSAVSGVSAMVDTEGINQWKDYLRFHLIEHYASVLPRAITAEHFSFHAKTFTGAQLVPNRAELAVDATNGALGQAVGQLYARIYFPPDSKARAQAIAGDLVTAFRARIANLTWMSSQTREKALTKLNAFKMGIGYPDSWIDYSTLDIVRGDAFGNMRRAEAFNRLRNLAKLKESIDPIEWPINPQIPGAVIMFSPNAEFFSAAILQPPYFDSHGDSASNYGSAGAGMAHEISHSFDELGNIYDANGRLSKWWSDEDAARFHAEEEKLVAQYNTYCPMANLCVKGKQVLSENVADLAGLLVAHDAYTLSLKGQTDVVVGGLSGEQRFFLAFAERWRRVQSEAGLRRQIETDAHAPGEYRSDAVRNVDGWYNVFKIANGDKLYVKPEDRVRIW